MEIIIISAVLFSALFYIAIGYFIGKDNKILIDFLPLQKGTNNYIKNAFEFSSSQTATIVSISTVIVVFFKYAYSMGFWLLWSVVTVAIGFFFIRWMSTRILSRLDDYQHVPTLHEFLGKSFNSTTLSKVSSIATIFGFLAAYALELIVCAKILSPLLVQFSISWIIFFLCFVGVVYTIASGYRGVVITDLVMMLFIWLFLIGLSIYYFYYFIQNGGFLVHLDKILLISKNPTLEQNTTIPSMMVGIFIINTFAYIADQSVFQRIVSTNQQKVANKGIFRSIIGSTIANIWLMLLACFVFAIIVFDENENPLITFLKLISTENNFLAKTTLFIAVLGIIGASLSTASTLLISCANTLHSDIISKIIRKKIEDQMYSIKALYLSRTILIISAIISIFIVQLFFEFNFDILDFIFAIFSSQLGMCFPLILALLLNKEKLYALSNFATWAVIIGFVTGWGIAIFGKMTGTIDLYSVPAILSLLSSGTIIGIGILYQKLKKTILPL